MKKINKEKKVDLDIDNYNLEDVLNLFKIPMDFNETDLKRAKQVVLKTHPDKSQLDPEYFRFYSKAYKMLFTIWEFRKRGDVDNNNKNTEYSIANIDIDNGFDDENKRVLLDNFFEKNGKFKTNRDFNKWFNKEFDKNKIQNDAEQKGYESWLRSDEDGPSTNLGNVSMATMSEEFEKKKSQMRALVKREEIMELNSRGQVQACDLSTDAPGSFNSDIFSSLPYQDLHQAHTETVIPVTHEDFENKQQFKNVNEFMTYRDKQDTKPLSEIQALEYLNNKGKKDDEMAVSRAYQLAKQTEQAKQKNNEFWSGLLMLKK
jgi:hypothetical protein